MVGAILTVAAVASNVLAAPRPMARDGHDVMRDGAAIYANECAACHLPSAKGPAGAGVYPSLASDPRLAAVAYPLHVVIHGQKGMPPFGAVLDNDQVAAVVTYVRSHFGNNYPGPVTAEEAKAER